MSVLGKATYYGIQRLRDGVTPRMVRRADELLNRPWSDVAEYVERRLERNYDCGEACGFEWLASQPVRSKEDYRSTQEATDSKADGASSGRSRRTSGSTGKPFTFSRGPEMLAWMDAAMWAVYGWYGIEPGDRMARFWGRPLSGLEAFKRSFADCLLRQRRMNAFEVSTKRSVSFYRKLLDWDPKYAYGYPTLMREFVEHLRTEGKDGRRLGLEVVITTGELLDPSTRTSLQEFFGCSVADEYGCSESGILTFECSNGNSHLIPIAAYAEVSGSTPRPDVKGEGSVLVTDLYGEPSPFVRYSLSDMGEIHPPSPCGCGRDLPRLEVRTGRVDSFIRTPDGEKVYDALLAYSVPSGVAQFQVRQSAVDRLEGQVVVAEGHEEVEVLTRCRSQWLRALGADIEIELEGVDRIERSDSGKHRYFIPMDDEDG